MKQLLFIPAIVSVLGAATAIQARPHVGFGFNINVPISRPHYHVVHQPVYRRMIIEQPEMVVVRRPARIVRRTYAVPAMQTVHTYRPAPSMNFGFSVGNCCRFF